MDEPTTDLLDRARASRLRGPLVSPAHRARFRNRTCGDEVALELRVDGSKVVEARFTGKGCFVSQASASLLCERIAGKEIPEIRQLARRELLGFAPETLSPLRQQCSLLACFALQSVFFPELARGESYLSPSLDLTTYVLRQESRDA